MSIKRLILSTFSIMVFFCLLLSYLVFELDRNQQALQQSHLNRYQSYLLADELRQSSDDLTHFMRSYVISGDERFKQYYFDVLAIRNGEKARPDQYNRIYWDLLINKQIKPRIDGIHKSLESMMVENGFSDLELAKLKQSQANSNALVQIELTAMNAVNGLYRGEDGKFTRQGPVNKEMAQQLMFGEEYYAEKAKIMQPVDDFFSMLDSRTLLEVAYYTEQDSKIFSQLVILTIFIILFTILWCVALIKFVLRPLGGEPAVMNRIAQDIIEGNLNTPFEDKARGVYNSLKKMTETLKRHHIENSDLSWLQNGQVSIDQALRIERNQTKISSQVLSTLAKYVNAEVGAIYVWQDNVLDNGEGVLKKTAGFALIDSPEHHSQYKLHEGLIGQAATTDSLTVSQNFPEAYLSMHSATGKHKAVQLVFIPFYYMGSLRGVIELAFLQPVSELTLKLLESLRESIGITFENVSAHDNLNQALEEAQNLSEELQTQQEELRVSNESLRSKSQDLEMQQEILLESKIDIENKAEQLEKSNQYKSEFLANMSHELRTPLNSLLILARSLSSNQSGNLSNEEAYSATVIQESGSHLLELVNHFLDLSKTEAGQMKIYRDDVNLSLLQKQFSDRFNVLATEKKIEFHFEIDPQVPHFLTTDKIRLEQILTNLIGNAIKFTDQGAVSTHIGINQQTDQIQFTVTDSGIGIAKELHEHIFQAFQQADSSMTRRYGGTGLGLSISRKLAQLLGGDVSVKSALNEGSTFYLNLPLTDSEQNKPSQGLRSIAQEQNIPVLIKNREKEILAKQILIAEDNTESTATLQSLLDFSGVNNTFVTTGQEVLDAVSKQDYLVVILDINLPDMSGFNVLEILANRDESKKTEYIIHTSHELNDSELLKISQYTDKIIMRSELSSNRLFDELAELLNGDLNVKPTINELSLTKNSTEIEKLQGKTILLVDDDMRNTFSLAKILRADGIHVDIASNGLQALEALKNNSNIDIVIMDMMMPGMDGYQTTIKIREQEAYKSLPIIACTAAILSENKEKCMAAGTNDYLTKPIDFPLLYKSLLACI